MVLCRLLFRLPGLISESLLGRLWRRSCALLLLTLFAWGLGGTPLVWAGNQQLTWLNQPSLQTQRFTHATQPNQIQFPRDLGPHADFQTEWWYYTGNLKTETGRPFGYQLTFFRSAIAPPPPQSPSPWRTPQLYSAHFTLSDIEAQQFYPYERYSRGAVGLAGAAADPYQVWLEDWSAEAIAPNQVRLQAQSAATAIDLVVSQTLPPILQGDRGLSQKGRESGNASYYYSMVQQPTTGKITVGDQTYPVSGITWKDHEYSTSALSAGTVGWDWFSLQLDNGMALMLYGLRHQDGSLEPTSGGTLIQADGSTVQLSPGDWQIDVQKTWKSPRSGAIYPARWAIALPQWGLDLQGQAQLADQELNTATATYWEGAVAFSGQIHTQPVTAQGYVELTGYADRLDRLLANR